ncbi:hypothetical protein MKW94_022069 [Papaver nudicaule]|uniref:Uncharacterized protein n=1 Tax=Papaver nudicaule TaxID=74823 RepID=A0AA41S693_PAPNU|nr:hypothetical protein [Papaver nudicaule]
MAKFSIIFSPFFFGLLVVILLAFISEGGVNAYDYVSCDTGRGIGYTNMANCDSISCLSYCKTKYGSSVVSGRCLYPAPNAVICFCCVST